MPKTIAGHGRDIELPDDKREKLLAAFHLGAGVVDASAFAGIPYRNVYRWLKNAEDPDADQVYLDLARDVEEARAAGVVHSLGILYEEKDWRAHARRISMIRPDQYSERRIEQHTVEVNHYVHIAPEAMRALEDDEVDMLERLVEKMQEARGELVQGEIVAEQ